MNHEETEEEFVARWIKENPKKAKMMDTEDTTPF
jgi:hypothetical protein